MIGFLAGFFTSLFSGGSGGPPPRIRWKLNHQGGDVQAWAQIDGIDPAYVPNWAPTGGIELVGTSKKAPLQKQPGPTATPTPQPRCQPSIAWAFLMAAEFNYDMYKGAAEGFEKGLVAGGVLGGAVTAPEGAEGLAPGALLGAGLGTIYGMGRGAKDFFDNFEKICGPQ